MFNKFSIRTAIALLLLLAACENPTLTIDPADEPLDGNVIVRVFQIESCTRLNYAIYTLDGERVKQINQTSDMPTFGQCAFQLEEDDYRLVVVGHSSNGNPTMKDPTSIRFTNAQGFTDTFMYSTAVTVTDEPADMQVTLERITSLCRFELTDEDIPSDVKKMRFYYTGGSGAFDATTGLGVKGSSTSTPSCTTKKAPSTSPSQPSMLMTTSSSTATSTSPCARTKSPGSAATSSPPPPPQSQAT